MAEHESLEFKVAMDDSPSEIISERLGDISGIRTSRASRNKRLARTGQIGEGVRVTFAR